MVVLLAVLLLGAWAEIQRRRFSNFFTLATEFKAFEVFDAAGWDSPRELARETLIASQQIVSQLRGFRGLRILWFDSLMLSEGAKEEFRNGMKGIGVTIVEAQDIEVAKKVAVEQRFDVIIANYGDPQKRYAYQLLAELDKRELRTPLVVYGMDPNPRFAKEARCYGAVTRATEVDSLFTAAMRGIGRSADARISDELRQKCIKEQIKPYDTAETWT